MNLTAQLVQDASRLTEEDITVWNRLARNPFQRWEWLGSWWNAYQRGCDLFVLIVRQDGKPIGFAPWFVESRFDKGRSIQFLGSGKVCSDHLSLLCDDDDIQTVTECLAQWLTSDAGSDDQSRWDHLELIGGDRDDATLNHFCGHLRDRGFDVEQSDGLPCFAITLPDDWETYVRMRSKSGRREIRQSQRNVDDGTIQVQSVSCESQIEELWPQFVDLHQRRRHSAGTTGCFDHPPFGDFLREAATKLLRSDLLRLVVAKHEDVPVAAQFALVDDEGWYFYQSGMEPEYSHLRPGLSVFCHSIRETIESGRQRFDMLRGDEAYKLRWRAEPCGTQEIRVFNRHAASQIRKQIYVAGAALKGMLKSGLSFSGPSEQGV